MIGDIKYYKPISLLVSGALLLCAVMLLILSLNSVSAYLATQMGEKKAFVIQLFFWAGLGASISSSLFLARDKEDNELESVKEKPDPAALRYPTDLDVVLYAHRIVTSGLLGVIGAAILFAGLGYFDTDVDISNTKQRMFFIVFCFLIGLNQGDFVKYLSQISTRLFQKAEKGKG